MVSGRRRGTSRDVPLRKYMEKMGSAHPKIQAFAVWLRREELVRPKIQFFAAWVRREESRIRRLLGHELGEWDRRIGRLFRLELGEWLAGV